MHVDPHPAADVPHKIHVPLKTNPKVEFWEADDAFYLAPGHSYEVNNKIMHGGANRSDEDRIHLVGNVMIDTLLRNKAAAERSTVLNDLELEPQRYAALTLHRPSNVDDEAAFSRILDALDKSGKADNTWIFYSADHGLAVGQHGLMGKQNMYDHSVRVPFMVVGPTVEAGSAPIPSDVRGSCYRQDSAVTQCSAIPGERERKCRSLFHCLAKRRPPDPSGSGITWRRPALLI